MLYAADPPYPREFLEFIHMVAISASKPTLQRLRHSVVDLQQIARERDTVNLPYQV
jgi:hypothetical protein